MSFSLGPSALAQPPTMDDMLYPPPPDIGSVEQLADSLKNRIISAILQGPGYNGSYGGLQIMNNQGLPPIQLTIVPIGSVERLYHNLSPFWCSVDGEWIIAPDGNIYKKLMRLPLYFDNGTPVTRNGSPIYVENTWFLWDPYNQRCIGNVGDFRNNSFVSLSTDHNTGNKLLNHYGPSAAHFDGFDNNFRDYRRDTAEILGVNLQTGEAVETREQRRIRETQGIAQMSAARETSEAEELRQQTIADRLHRRSETRNEADPLVQRLFELEIPREQYDRVSRSQSVGGLDLGPDDRRVFNILQRNQLLPSQRGGGKYRKRTRRKKGRNGKKTRNVR